MTPKKLANQANKAIILWAQGRDKLIVAIDGYAGIGKTTLLNNLAKINPGIVAVNWDDFILSRDIFKKKLAKAKDRSKVFELEVGDSKKLKDFISAYRTIDKLYKMDAYDGSTGKVNLPRAFDFSKKIMIIEGVFMFHPELSRSKFWDKRIYLKGNMKKITERRIKREKKRWGKNYISETHPDSYFKQVVIALDRYIKLHRPEKIADLVLRAD